MRCISIQALLLATYACAAQPSLSADRLPGSLLRADLFRIADGQPRPEPVVNVCLVTDPNRLIVDAAKTLASMMFAGIRVGLRWYEPPVCRAGTTDPVFVTLQTLTPKGYFPRALGTALPLEGSHAWVFYDRVRRSYRGDKYVAALLAHVMAHEIAHVLQGSGHHSDSGIMKAQWSDTECARIAYFPLMFTREDEVLIHRGLEERHSRLASSASAPSPLPAGGRSLPVP